MSARFFTLLLAVSSFLISCSNSGGDNKSPGVFPGGAILKDYAPTFKPQDSAPSSYISQVRQAIKQSTEVIPADALIYNTVIVNDDVESVSEAQRQKELAKLTFEGRRILQDIHNKCVIRDATKTVTGSKTQGGSEEVKISHSTEGNGCPLRTQRSLIQTNHYDKMQADHVQGSKHIILRMYGANKISSAVLDPRASALAGVLSIDMELQSAGNVDIRTDGNTMKMNASITVSGNLSIDLTNGDKIFGPITIQEIITEQSQEIQYLFDGRSPQGALRLVVIQKTAETEAYLNGDKLDIKEWSELGVAARSQFLIKR